jgi:hypothetical protein
VESLTRPSANEKTSQSHDVPKRRVDKTGTDADTAGLVVPPKADPQFVDKQHCQSGLLFVVHFDTLDKAERTPLRRSHSSRTGHRADSVIKPRRPPFPETERLTGPRAQRLD